MLNLPTAGEWIDLFVGVLILIGIIVFLLGYCFGIYFWVPKKHDRRYSIKLVIKRTAFTCILAVVGSLFVSAIIYVIVDFGFGDASDSLVEDARRETLYGQLDTLNPIWYFPLFYFSVIVIPITLTTVALKMFPESQISKYFFRMLTTLTGGVVGFFLNLYVLILIGRLLFPFSWLLNEYYPR